MPKPLTVWITTNCGKFFRRWEYQTILPVSWETCMWVKKQQLELVIEQQTGSKLETEYGKAVYCYPVYLTYMQSAALCLVTQSCPTLCNPMDCSPPGFSVHGDSPGKNTEVGCHALLQGIFPTQGSNLGLPHGRQKLYSLSHHWTSPLFHVPF